jgi:uncharacterized protein YqiB (DUF1249 family)
LGKPLCYIHIVLSDSYIVPECIVRPGTLGGLISLYESNFLKLASLLGDPWHLSGQFVSRCSKDCDLHLCIEDGSRYTRELRLTYLFDEPAGRIASRHSRELDRRWARNIVLGKWLDYLLDNGHSYAVTGAR